jgi:hypothetical protein
LIHLAKAREDIEVGGGVGGGKAPVVLEMSDKLAIGGLDGNLVIVPLLLLMTVTLPRSTCRRLVVTKDKEE